MRGITEPMQSFMNNQSIREHTSVMTSKIDKNVIEDISETNREYMSSNAPGMSRDILFNQNSSRQRL
jgi:hypothetical protein